MRTEDTHWWPIADLTASGLPRFKKHRFLIWPIGTAIAFSIQIVIATLKSIPSALSGGGLFIAVFAGIAGGFWWNHFIRRYVREGFLDYGLVNHKVRVLFFCATHLSFLILFFFSLQTKTFAVLIAAFFLVLSVCTILAVIWFERKTQRQLLCVEPLLIEDLMQVYAIWILSFMVIVS